MRRLSIFVVLSALVAIPMATSLQAQNAHTTSPHRSFAAFPASSIPHARGSALRSSHHSFLHRVVMGLGAAIAGAYVGYFFSEVAHGDWHPVSGGQFQPSGPTINRGLWTGVGGAAGFALGFSFSGGSTHPVSAGSLPALPPGLPVGRSMLTAEEIASSKAKTAYDAVQDLRPTWLPKNVQFIATGVSIPFRSDIPVYEDSARIGGLEELAKVPVGDVEAMYRLDAGQARARFGDPDPNGAILIIGKH